MKKIMISVVLSLFIFGCSGMTINIPEKEIPEGCEDSLILNNLPAPDIVDVAVKLAVIEIAKAGYKTEVTGAINNILYILEDDVIIGRELVAFIVSQVAVINEYAGIELIIVMDSINVLNINTPLIKCDVDILKNHLNEELYYLNLVKEN